MKLKCFYLLAQALGHAGIAIAQGLSETNTNLAGAILNSALGASNTPFYCPGNSARNRSTWCNHNTSTDYQTVFPHTGVIREYWFNVTNTTIYPLGRPVQAITVNGTVPGPTIFADWGDEVRIHVTNNLETWNVDHSTDSPGAVSIHWHGIRQLNSPMYDGVPSITQCPIVPGKPFAMTYIWNATQYGTSWYHSHVDLQAWQGLFGGVVINGPATHDYDEDLGVLFLNDWDNKTMHELYNLAQQIGPVTLDTGLLNGTNEYQGIGNRLRVNVTEGKSYRLRIVNAAVDTMFKFSIDSHNFTLIAMDLVPIHPISNKSTVSITMGQRYDLVFTANKRSLGKSFKILAVPTPECSENKSPKDIYGFLDYIDSPVFRASKKLVSIPSTCDYGQPCPPPENPFVWTNPTCYDEPMDSLRPFVSKDFGDNAHAMNTVVDLTKNLTAQRFFRWTLNQTNTRTWWETPSLWKIWDRHGFEWDAPIDGAITTPGANEWVYLLINNTHTADHPIHLHGHDFYILAQGSRDTMHNFTLTTHNPPRRDTALVEGGGYLVIGWITDNPGVWLMHCHIGWHTEEGFALQFIERQHEIPGLLTDYVDQMCSQWKALNANQGEYDSGF